MIDVLVAGGGPAGLAVAIRCAMAGLSVTVAEPRGTPIDKACGEGLMPAAVERLDAIGVHPDGHPLRGIRYADATHSVDACFRGRGGLGVRRTVLHAALAARAAELEIAVRPGRVAGFDEDEDGVTVTVRRGGAPDGTGVVGGSGVGGSGTAADKADEVRARYLIAADGLHSALRRMCGLEPAPAKRPRFGLRRHYQIAPWTDLVEVHWAADAEAYVTPVAADQVGVAILGAKGGGFDERLAAFPAVRERLSGAGAASEVRGAGPLRQDVRRRVEGRVLLAGDASGYQDALTGEGIGAALGQASVLADCLAAGRPADYERDWRRVTRKSRALTGGLLWSRHQPLLAPRIVPAAAGLPWLFAAIVNQVGSA